MCADTVFDLASLSKVMGTATLAAILVERGWIGWDSPLDALLPGSKFPGVSVRHLLSHTAGFAAWAPFWEKLRERFPPGSLFEVPIAERQSAMREFVLASKTEAAPGVRALYSDVSFLLLGFALEEVTRLPLDQAIETYVLRPMGITGARYFRTDRAPAQGLNEEIAATEKCTWRGSVLQGQVHDDNCWSMGGYGGHAGIFANAADVLKFGAHLLSGFLSKSTLTTAWTRVASPPACERTAGWDTPSGDTPSVGRKFSTRSVGHLGFTGTSLWIDPDAGVAVTLLSNRVHFGRENTLIRAFRPAFHDAIREDLKARL